MQKSKFYIIISSLVFIFVLTSVLFAFSFAKYLDAAKFLKQYKDMNDYNIHTSQSCERIIINTYPAISSSDYSEYLYSIEEEGVLFLSEVEAWNGLMLKELANELLANTYGDEISLLNEVIVVDDPDKEISAELVPSSVSYNIPMSIRNLLPESSSFSMHYSRNAIYVY